MSPLRSTGLVAGMLLSAGLLLAQQNSGWRRVDQPPPASVPAPPNTAVAQAPPAATPAPGFAADPSTPVAPPDDAGVPAGPPPAAPPDNSGFPARLVIPGGKAIVVRVNQVIASNHNQVGDFFTATLAEPIVVDGFVVAQRGQTVNGRVSAVDKGGKFGKNAKLGLQLTQLTAVDGQQLPIQTMLVGRTGRSTTPRDAGILAGSTGLGAAVGAAAGWPWHEGEGAAIGAGAGAALGLAGVLLSPNAPAVVTPETLLSFQIQGPVPVDTSRSPQSFQQINPNEYQQPPYPPQPTLRTGPGVPPPGPYPYPYYGGYGYGYAYPYYPYWGPSFGVVIGPGFYGRGYYGYRGGYRGYYGYRGFRR